jgi:hypothetical protein
MAQCCYFVEICGPPPPPPTIYFIFLDSADCKESLTTVLFIFLKKIANTFRYVNYSAIFNAWHQHKTSFALLFTKWIQISSLLQHNYKFRSDMNTDLESLHIPVMNATKLNVLIHNPCIEITRFPFCFIGLLARCVITVKCQSALYKSCFPLGMIPVQWSSVM